MILSLFTHFTSSFTFPPLISLHFPSASSSHCSPSFSRNVRKRDDVRKPSGFTKKASYFVNPDIFGSWIWETEKLKDKRMMAGCQLSEMYLKYPWASCVAFKDQLLLTWNEGKVEWITWEICLQVSLSKLQQLQKMVRQTVLQNFWFF